MESQQIKRLKYWTERFKQVQCWLVEHDMWEQCWSDIIKEDEDARV